MIPTAFLQAWSVKAPWPDLRQVEEDLIPRRVPRRNAHTQTAVQAAAALFGRYRPGADAGRTHRCNGRCNSRRIVVAWKMPKGAGRSLDASGVQVHARGRFAGNAQAQD